MRSFHTIVIGAGSGGMTVMAGLAGFGKTVAIVEKTHVGGDCTNVGCVPSKTLIHLADTLPGHGLTPAEVMAEVRRKRDALRDEETEQVQTMDNVTLFSGSATLTGRHTVRVDADGGGSEEIRAENIVVASGSRPLVIPIDDLPDSRLVTNETLWDIEDMPGHMVIVGAGVIGAEMAFAFHKLGVRVSVVDLAPRTLSVLEPEVSELIEARMRERGIDLVLNARADRYDNATATLYLDQQGREVALEGVDKVLMAVGRRPNLDLGLEAAGVEYGRDGVPTNAFGRSNVANIYAIGDVNVRSAFTHSANSQGRRLVQKLALPWLPVGEEPVWPSATFTDPEIAQVGDPLATLQTRYHAELIRTVRVDLADTDRGYTMGLRRGFVLIHALRLTGRVLSATIVAPDAGEMIAILTLAVNRRLTLYRLANLVFPYPVLSEAIRKAADRFVFATLPALGGEGLAFVRYRFARPAGAGGRPGPLGAPTGAPSAPADKQREA